MTRKIDEEQFAKVTDEAAVPAPATPLCGQTVVAECLDAKHPSLSGRVLLKWAAENASVERWCPTIQGLAVRSGDRVLLHGPDNFHEPVVIGVLDGFAQRPTLPRTGPSISIAQDEEVLFTDEHGGDIARVHMTPAGPVVRLLTGDASIELDGKLKVSAKEIELRARQGELKLDARDDVIVKGELIHLN